MKLENIALEEIRPFVDSLTVEEKYFEQPLDILLNAEFVTGVRLADNLAGIGGITISYRIFPLCFYIVRSEFQGKGIGYEISRKIIRFAKTRYSFLLLVTHKANISALKLYHKSGFRIVYKRGDSYWMFLPLNKRGGIIGKLLPLIIGIDLSPIGDIARLIRRLFSQNKRHSI